MTKERAARVQQDRTAERSCVGQLYIQTPDSLQQTAFLAWPPPPPVPHWIDQLPQGSSQRRPGQVIWKSPKKFWLQQMVNEVFADGSGAPAGAPRATPARGPPTRPCLGWCSTFSFGCTYIIQCRCTPFVYVQSVSSFFHFICINHVITACHMLPFSPCVFMVVWQLSINFLLPDSTE